MLKFLKSAISLILLVAILVATLPLNAFAQSKKAKASADNRPADIVYYVPKGQVPSPSWYEDTEQFKDAPVYPAKDGQIHVDANPVVEDGLLGYYAQHLPPTQELISLEKPVPDALVMTRHGYFLKGLLPVKDIHGNPVKILIRKSDKKWLAVGNCGNPYRDERTPPPSPPTPQPKLPKPTVTKLVADSSGIFKKEVTVESGDRVTFQLTFANKGEGVAHNAKFIDPLPGDSLTLVRKNIPKGHSGGAGNPWEFGDFAPGEQVVVTYECIVEKEQGAFNNVVTFWCDEVKDLQDWALVVVECPKPEPEHNPLPKPGKIEISKEVRDLSDQKSNFGREASSAPGHNMEYLITVTNPGDKPLYNVVIHDNYANGDVEFKLKETRNLNRNLVDVELRESSKEFFIKELKPHTEVKIRYQGKVKIKKGEAINTVSATAESGEHAEAQAKVYVKERGFSLAKVLIPLAAGVVIITAILLAGGGGGSHGSKPGIPTSNPR